MRHNAVASIWVWFIIVAAKTGGTIRAGEIFREFNQLVVLARTGALGQMSSVVAVETGIPLPMAISSPQYIVCATFSETEISVSDHRLEVFQK